MPSRRMFLATLAVTPLSTAETDPSLMTLSEAAALIRQRKLTPLEVTEACLRRIELLNPRLNAFITVMADAARARARALRPGDAAGQPLHGIPIGLKDLYDTAGVRTTAGSAQWLHRVPTESAEVVRRLETAGAIVVGKANMDEFAYNFTSETSAFQPARNPWQTSCTPGGSSGGSAIAVAAGMSLAALGSDTGGSVRLPASFCGITGFKPTWGRVPLDGVTPLSWSLDTCGPFTRTASDATALQAVLRGQPVPLESTKRLRIGVPRELFWDHLQPAVERAVTAAGAILRRICGGVRDLRIPALPLSEGTPLPEAYSRVIFSEAYAFHREMLLRNPEGYHPGTRASIEMGKPIDAATYILARREMERLRANAAATLFRDADLLLTPTAPGVAFPLGSNPDLVFLRNTAPWNLYGLPTVSIPCGFSESGMPIGLQLTGKPDADATVLSAAAAFQQETDFHAKRPAL
ncbi:MAG: amidase [Bryobacterales bacterium]|nr:amidase [Bryobacterales bacterium]